MTDTKLYTQIAALPNELKNEVSHFAAFLQHKLKKETSIPIKERQFGCAKGLIKMAPDFDESLEEFKDCM